jgi:2-dehydropantoate 2-reductase
VRIAVFGSGGVGGYFGARLAAAGEEVVFLARGAHLRAMQSTGLRVVSPLGDLHLDPAHAAADPAEIGPVDAVLCAVKAWQVPDVAVAMAPLLGPRTVVLPLENGVEAADQIAAAVGRERVLGGACWIVARIEAPGVIRHDGVEPRVVLGELDGEASPRAAALAAAFTHAGVRCEASREISAVLWRKFLFITPTSALGAVTALPPAAYRAVAETRAVLIAALEEIAAVARAHGVPLGPADVVDTLAFIDGLPANATSSFQRDVAEGRPSELEAQSGAVVRLGAAEHVPTPVHAFLYAALLPRERLARSRA